MKSTNPLDPVEAEVSYHEHLKNLPAPLEVNRSLVIPIPSARKVYEKLIVEDAPPKHHFLTMVSIMGTVLLVILLATFPVIAKVMGAAAIYACVHAAVYFMFFKKSDYSGDYY